MTLKTIALILCLCLFESGTVSANQIIKWNAGGYAEWAADAIE